MLLRLTLCCQASQASGSQSKLETFTLTVLVLSHADEGCCLAGSGAPPNQSAAGVAYPGTTLADQSRGSAPAETLQAPRAPAVARDGGPLNANGNSGSTKPAPSRQVRNRLLRRLPECPEIWLMLGTGHHWSPLAHENCSRH